METEAAKAANNKGKAADTRAVLAANQKGGEMKKILPRDTPTPEIVVPKGYDLSDLIDTDDNGYGFEDEAIYTEEVIVKCERGEE